MGFRMLQLQSTKKHLEYAQMIIPEVQIVPVVHLFQESPHHWTAICFERLRFFTILQYSSDSGRVKNCSKRVVRLRRPRLQYQAFDWSVRSILASDWSSSRRIRYLVSNVAIVHDRNCREELALNKFQYFNDQEFSYFNIQCYCDWVEQMSEFSVS